MKPKYLVIASLLILVFIGASGAVIQKKTQKICSETSDALKQTEAAAEAGELDLTVSFAHELEEYWRDQEFYIGMFYEHEFGYRVGESLARISAFAECGAIDSLKAEVADALSHIEALASYDNVSTVNIF